MKDPMQPRSPIPANSQYTYNKKRSTKQPLERRDQKTYSTKKIKRKPK